MLFFNCYHESLKNYELEISNIKKYVGTIGGRL